MEGEPVRFTALFIDGYIRTMSDPRRRLPDELRGRTDDEIIDDVEDLLLRGRFPEEVLTPKALKDLHDLLDKAPLTVDKVFFTTQEDQDDLLAWSKEV